MVCVIESESLIWSTRTGSKPQLLQTGLMIYLNSLSALILTMLYQIQDSITELKEQVNKKDTETIQAIMQTSLNNVKKEESADAIMMKMLLPELIKNPESFQNLMQIAEIANKSKK